jgi:hypothetical protein
LNILSSVSSPSSDISFALQLFDSPASKKSLYIAEADDEDDEPALSIFDVLRVLLKGENIDGEKRDVK